MEDATLMYFREVAAVLESRPTDWQWIGPFSSQRMFGITEARAKEYARSHGGAASQMVSQ